MTAKNTFAQQFLAEARDVIDRLDTAEHRETQRPCWR